MPTTLKYQATHNNEDDEGKNRQKLKWQVKNILKNFCNKSMKKKSKELAIQFSHNIETTNHAFIIESLNFHRLQEVSEFFKPVDRGKNPESRKTFVRKRSRRWVCYFLQTKMGKFWKFAETIWKMALSSRVLHALNSLTFYLGTVTAQCKSCLVFLVERHFC